MGVGEEEGRAAFENRAWAQAWQAFTAVGTKALNVDDLERLAVAGYLSGHDDGREAWEEAYEECVRTRRLPRAARCAFWLAFGLLEAGAVSLGAGWLARARQRVDQSGEDCVERGYLLVPEAIATFDEDLIGALERFVAAGQTAARFGDRDLAALARLGEGEARIALGERSRALSLIDEAMVVVTTAGGVSPIVAGLVLCGAVAAAQQALDLRRASEWTEALHQWCEAQPELVAFRGQCLVHRAEIHQLRGAWDDALDEAQRACALLGATRAGGDACYRLAELHRLRGELDEAETQYRAAEAAGRDPQPGLALLALARGDTSAAVGSIRQLADDAIGPLDRARVLAPLTEIMLAAGEVGAAREAVTELISIAQELEIPLLRAIAAQADGAVHVAEGDPAGAFAPLRQAGGLWRDMVAPYDELRVRELLAVACRAVGDLDSAALDLAAAQAGFEGMGAALDAARAARLAREQPPDEPRELTPEEVEVLTLVARGDTNSDIAAALMVSEHTVARHVQNIFAKLRVRSRAAAADHAHSRGLV